MSKSNDFWMGRLAVEAVIAIGWLEGDDPESAYEGLKEVVDELLKDKPDPDLINYLEEIRRDQRELTPVDIPYRDGNGQITGEEIASKL